jgi:HSP20 family molecular chaperone IbpA
VRPSNAKVHHRVERVSEYATRALRMPEQADLSTIDASIDGGVLIVKVPKKIARLHGHRTSLAQALLTIWTETCCNV